MLGHSFPFCFVRKSILVRTGRCKSGCGGRKLFPNGAFGCSGVPCIRRLNACNYVYRFLFLFSGIFVQSQNGHVQSPDAEAHTNMMKKLQTKKSKKQQIYQ